MRTDNGYRRLIEGLTDVIFQCDREDPDDFFDRLRILFIDDEIRMYKPMFAEALTGAEFDLPDRAEHLFNMLAGDENVQLEKIVYRDGLSRKIAEYEINDAY